MKFKSNDKKMWIGVVAAIGVISIGTFAVRYNHMEDMLLKEDNTNYSMADLKTLAMYKSDDGSNYTEITTMPDTGYVINEEKSYCTTDGVTKVTGKLKTVDGVHAISNLNKNDKCYLYFDKYTPSITIPEIIAALNAKTETPDFSVVATTDEGIYRVSDGMYGGYSYYWRGAATTNYVKFAGFCWRIVRINGDGSFRLIYDGTTCHANGTSTTDSIAVANTAYNSNYNKLEYVGWKYTSGVQRPSSITSGTDTTIKTALESWYATNITNKGYDGKVATGKFCNDRNVASGYTWASAPSSTVYYAARTRLHTDYAPTLSCATLDTYSLKIGLITADEVEFAGGLNANNTAYYLYNGQYYWTMSPYNWHGPNSYATVFLVSMGGYLDAYGVSSKFGVRPVINLASSTTFAAGGTGTQSNPYVVS